MSGTTFGAIFDFITNLNLEIYNRSLTFPSTDSVASWEDQINQIFVIENWMILGEQSFPDRSYVLFSFRSETGVPFQYHLETAYINNYWPEQI